MTVLRGIRTGTAALFVSAVGVLAMASPATAAPVPVTSTPCADNTFCLFENRGFTGHRFNAHVSRFGCITLDASVNNKVSSYANRTFRTYAVYDNNTCGGAPLARITARTADNAVGPLLDNRIGSIRQIG
jgi:hypothetical protein